MSRLGGEFIAEVEIIVRKRLICQDIVHSHNCKASYSVGFARRTGLADEELGHPTILYIPCDGPDLVFE